MKIFIFRESEMLDLNPIVARQKGMGATETCFIELANSLSKNHNVKVCCPCKEHKYYKSVEYIPYQNYSQVLINSNVFESDYIIIVGNPNILFNVNFKQKVVFWQHNHPDEINHLPIQRLFGIEGLRIVFPSPEAAKVGIARYGNEDKISGIYNGVRLDIFSKQEEKEKGKIVFCGALTRAKGLHALLSALVTDNRLHKYKFCACSDFDLYGFIDKEYMEYCMTYVGNFNLSITGVLNPYELADQLSTAELCICNPVLGHKETCCVSALEAMACNTPVLCGDSSINSIIEHGGQTFKTSLSESIREMMDNEDKRKVLAATGKEWVNSLSWDNVAKDWEKLFLDCK